MKRSCLRVIGTNERRSEQKEEKPVTGERTDTCCVELCEAEDFALGSCRGGWLQVVSGWARSAPRTSQNGSQVNVSLRPGALRTAQVIFQPDFQVLVQNITGCLIPIQTKLISELQYVLQTVSVAPPRYFCTIDVITINRTCDVYVLSLPYSIMFVHWAEKETSEVGKPCRIQAAYSPSPRVHVSTYQDQAI
jgi:hypothetical protein